MRTARARLMFSSDASAFLPQINTHERDPQRGSSRH
jgi:hypothetical protein